MTYSFADPADLERMRHDCRDDELLRRAAQPDVRRAVASCAARCCPGLLRSVSYNQRRGVRDVHLYEIGSTFRTAEGRKQPKERAVVAGVLAGAWHAPGVERARGPARLLRRQGRHRVARPRAGRRAAARSARPSCRTCSPVARPKCCSAGKSSAGSARCTRWCSTPSRPKAPVTAFELDLAAARARAPLTSSRISDVPRFPGVELDVALVVPEDVTAERVEQAIGSAGGKLLESVRLFDVYRGEGVPEGKKSLAFALIYRAPDRTLTAEEVEGVHDRLVRKVSGAVGGELRR